MNNINSMNNVSFNGHIIATTWNNMKCKTQFFETSAIQDKYLKKAIKNRVKINKETVLTKDYSNYIHKMIEKYTGSKFPNIKGHKIAYNYDNSVRIADENYRLFDGVEFDIDFS